MKIKNNKFIKNTIMQYIMTFGQFVFPLLTFPYLTRILEPNTYGVIVFMTATISYFQIFVDFGFNLSSTKHIAEHQEDKQYIGRYLGNTIQAKFLLVACSFIIFIAMIPFIKILRENTLLAFLYMGVVVLSVFLPDFLFRGIEKMEIITIRFLVSKAITTALTFVLVRSKGDMFLIPILNMLGSLVAVLLTWYEIKKLEIHMQFSNLKQVMQVIKESSIYFVSTFATTAFGATNTFMLGAMSLPTTQIAYWGISYNLISSAQSLYSPIVNSLYPRMVAKKDYKLVKRLLYIFMPAIIVTATIVYVLSGTIINVFCGPQYTEAVPIFRALLPVLIFSFPAMIIGFPVLGVIGKVKETTITAILSAIFHVVGLLILAIVRRFTVLNIAILRSLTEAILLGTRGYVLAKTMKSKD